MQTKTSLRKTIVILTVSSILHPSLASGQEIQPAEHGRTSSDLGSFATTKGGSRSPELARAKVHDVRLDTDQTFHGLVLNGQGKPVAEQVVILTREDANAQKWQVQTDKQGSFVVRGLSAGTYQLQTRQGISICRLWTSEAAPPKSASTLLVVDDPLVERGQRPISELFRVDPVLMATVVAAAIAIPIVIHKSRDDSGSGS